MKNVTRLVVVCAAAALFSVTTFAQDAAAPAAPAANQDCEAAKTDPNLYPKWLENRTGDAAKQKIAYDAGKAFLAKCEGVTGDAYVAAVQKFVARYDEAVGKLAVRTRFEDAVKAFDAAPTNAKPFAQVFTAGKDYVAAEPENLNALLVLTNVGYLNAIAGESSVKSLDAEAVNYARRALQLLEAGKGTPDHFKLLGVANMEDAVTGLHYRLGIINRGVAPEEAVNSLLKVAQGNGPLKNDPSLFYFLAQAYTNGPYKKLIAEYQQKFPEGQTIPDERKAEYDMYQARLEQAVDRIIDAYARAVAFNTKTDAASVTFKNTTTQTLTGLYKQRHGETADPAQFIAASSTRRLPLPSDPLPTPPPAPTPTPTPTPTTGTTTPPAAAAGATSGSTATSTPAAKPKP